MNPMELDIPAWLAALVVTLGGIGVGLRKLYLDWSRDGVSLAETSARKTIVQQLHDELTRMSAQNITLAGELNKLQLHILELTKQISTLSTKNAQLEKQISALSTKNAQLENEISQLRQEINRLRTVSSVSADRRGESNADPDQGELV
jgi:chromosome segregation ATPase